MNSQPTNKITTIVRIMLIVVSIFILMTSAACDNGDGDDTNDNSSAASDYWDKDPMEVCEGQEGDNLRACVSAFIQARADHENAEAQSAQDDSSDDSTAQDVAHSDTVQSINPISPIVCTFDNTQAGCNP